MKHIIAITSILAAGTLLANAETYNDLLASTDGWQLVSNRGRGSFTIDTAQETLNMSNSNWGQGVASYDFMENITLGEGEALRFSLDMNVLHSNGSFVFTLVGSDQVIAIGKNYDQDVLSYGVESGSTDKLAFQFKENADTYTGKLSSKTDSSTSTNALVSISGTIEKNEALSEYILNLTLGGSEIISGIRLGASFELDKIGFYGDGANNTSNVTFSNLSISTIPEPLAFGLLAGLGALALAGTRRRRRK